MLSKIGGFAKEFDIILSMWWKVSIAIIIVVIIGAILLFNNRELPSDNLNNDMKNQKNTLVITSPAFGDNEMMPAKYTCDGEGINPLLEISGVPNDVPNEAKSLAIIMDDPDAVKPAGKVWDHWIIWNIPPQTTQINEGQEPTGVHGIGTSGNSNYHGPCPPDTVHRYFFKIYALDTMLNLPAGSTKSDLERAMVNHIVAEGQLIGLYERKKQ